MSRIGAWWKARQRPERVRIGFLIAVPVVGILVACVQRLGLGEVLRWPHTDEPLAILGTAVAAASLPYAVWQWLATHAYVGRGGLNCWTVGFALVGATLYGLAAVGFFFAPWITSGAIETAIPDLGLAYLGFALGSLMMARDSYDRVDRARKAGEWHETPPSDWGGPL